MSAKRGLRCTQETAIEYIDDLAAHHIEIGMALELEKQEPGMWKGDVDLSRIWSHDETSQFINLVQLGSQRRKSM